MPKLLVPVTLAELMDHEVGMGAVGKEAQPVAVAARFENIVDVQGDRRVRPRAVFDERGPICGAVEVRIELVGPIKSEALVVAD